MQSTWRLVGWSIEQASCRRRDQHHRSRSSSSSTILVLCNVEEDDIVDRKEDTQPGLEHEQRHRLRVDLDHVEQHSEQRDEDLEDQLCVTSPTATTQTKRSERDRERVRSVSHGYLGVCVYPEGASTRRHDERHALSQRLARYITIAAALLEQTAHERIEQSHAQNQRRYSHQRYQHHEYDRLECRETHLSGESACHQQAAVLEVRASEGE